MTYSPVDGDMIPPHPTPKGSLVGSPSSVNDVANVLELCNSVKRRLERDRYKLWTSFLYGSACVEVGRFRYCRGCRE